MKFDILTLFPEMLDTILSTSIIGRAQQSGALSVGLHNIRDHSTDLHHRVDDYPYGGGRGMVMTVQPILDCYKHVAGQGRPHTIYLSPKGKTLTQQRAIELSKLNHILLLCGHYEGVDQRVIDEIVDEEISIGDYVLTGGELAAAVMVDCVGRLLPGVLGKDAYGDESHYNSLLEYPHYTRPAEIDGRVVPDILLSGHHANIEAWRREESLKITLERRPDLLADADLSEKDKCFLAKLGYEQKQK